MRVAYFDCFAGISGDMTVGALLSAGMPLAHLQSELSKLPLAGYSLEQRTIERSMISAIKFDVQLTIDSGHGHSLPHTHEQSHTREHSHSHDHGHTHSHGHKHSHDDAHSHDDHAHADHNHTHSSTDVTTEIHVHTHGYSYTEIQDLIAGSTLANRVKTRALEIFRHIAIAESRIHNVSLQEVHFHELGAIDSIVDIVSVAIGLDYFNVDECRSRAVPLGSGGFIKTAHGIMPIPTPATLDILKEYPTISGREEAEMTTPTGAGIIRALSSGLLKETEELTPVAIGYGAGTKEFKEVPNLLRIVIGELNVASHSRVVFPETDEVVQLTTTIDDMPPMVLAYVQDLLLQHHALDVYLRPVSMKKGRQGHEVVVLVGEELVEDMLGILARETTTIGVRVERLTRRIARRKATQMHSKAFGNSRTKTIDQASFTRTELEYEEVKRIARERDLPFREVYDQLRRELL